MISARKNLLKPLAYRLRSAIQIGLWRREFFAGMCIFTVVFIIYSNAFFVPMIFDSQIILVESNQMHSLENPFRFFSNGRGLADLSFALNYAWTVDSYWSYQLVNIVIHIVNAIVIYLFLRLLFHIKQRDYWPGDAHVISLTCSLLWAVHPLQTQSVTYTIQRYESLMSLGILVAITASILEWCVKSSKYLWAGRIGVVLGVLWAVNVKQVAIVFPVILVCFDVVLRNCNWRELLIRRWCCYLGVLIIIYFFGGPQVSRAFLVSDSSNISAGFSMQGMTWWEYFVEQPKIVIHYLGLILWPRNLILDYGRHYFNVDWTNVVSFVVVTCFFLISLYGLFLRQLWSLGGVWFFLLLAPTSSVMPIADLAVEHRVYLAMLGPLVIFVYWGVYWIDFLLGRKCFFLVVFIVIALLGLRTFQRNEDYCNEVNFWKSNICLTPNNPRCNINYALSLDNAGGSFELAKKHFEIALILSPENPIIINKYAVFLAKNGRKSEALVILRRLLESNGEYVDALNSLGSILMLNNQVVEAEHVARRTIKLDVGNSNAWVVLACSLCAQERLDKASFAINRSFQLAPHSKIVLEQREMIRNYVAQRLRDLDLMECNDSNALELPLKKSSILMSIGRHDRAIEAIRVSSMDALAKGKLLNQAAERFLASDDLLVCVLYLEAAVEVCPSRLDLINNLAVAEVSRGNHSRAEELFKHALDLDPNSDLTICNFAKLLMIQGDADKAREILERAIKTNPKSIRTGKTYRDLFEGK